MKKYIAIILLQIGLALNPLGAADVYVPNLISEGGSAESLIGRLPTHFQQVYSASEFQGLPAGGADLTALCFRVDGPLGFTAFAVITNLQVMISTTTRGPDQLSTTFASNLGSDAKIVLAPSLYPFEADGGQFNGTPNPFTGCFYFTTPFSYDPSMGNLLIDIQTFSNNRSIPPFDAVNILGDSVSSVASYNGNLNVGQADTRGLLTDLFFVPVPEPSVISLGILGATTAVLYRLRARKRKAA